MWLEQAILYKKAALSKLLAGPMASLADACVDAWPDAAALDAVLATQIREVPHCELLYVLDTDGKQISSNVSLVGIDAGRRGQDLSARPYLGDNLPYRGFTLSTVYISTISSTPCITAVQAIGDGGRLLGFIAADFNLNDIPLLDITTEIHSSWTQYKGDPVIRQSVFQQSRIKSRMDGQLGQVMEALGRLMCEHGIYHVIIHFSSSRAVFWLYDDPYNYRLHSVDEIVHPEIWLAYPARAYPAQAKVSCEQVRQVLEYYKALRLADDNIYLRSASLNIMNGLVGLTFSCDGSHYMQVEEFLNRELSFWI